MGLFDIVQPRVAELGKIKIGGKKAETRQSSGGGEWRAPEKYDHFVVTTLHRDEKGDLIRDEALMASMSEFAGKDGKLRQLPVAVLSDDIDEVMQASWVWYSGKRVAARSDGKTLTKFFENGNWLPTPKFAEWKPELAEAKDSGGNRLFKMHAVFNCVITAKQAHWGGVYKFRTTSQITASQLAGSLLEIKQLTGGKLRGMPLRLAIRPLQVSPNGVATTVYVVHCELVGDDLLQLQNMAMERAKVELSYASQIRSASIEYRKLIAPPGVNESERDVVEITEEFHPELAARITAEQTERISELLKTLGHTADWIKPHLPERYCCTELAQLDKSQADDVIKRLESALPKKPKAVTTVAPPAPAPAKQPEPVPTPTPAPATELKQADIPLADVHCEICSERDNRAVAHSPPACTPESIKQPNPAVPPTTLQTLAEFDGSATPAAAPSATVSAPASSTPDVRAELLGQIRQLMRSLKYTDAQVLPILKKDYDAAGWDALTAENAQKVVERLTTKLAEKKSPAAAKQKV